MPSIEASLEYLQKLPLYETEKPYWCFVSPQSGIDPDAQRLDNLEFEHHPDITITDIREHINEYKIGDCGFEVLSHGSEVAKFDTEDAIEDYRRETEALLTDAMDAVYAHCYDSALRKNVTFVRSQFDMNDRLLVGSPARGVHNDITYDSGPVIINRYLSERAKELYLKPGYRVRIVNTWRPLLPVLEDRPLALCDSRSVSFNDLVPADRISPDRVGEVYYLNYNKNHQWYWLENQKNSEPYAFVMYDTEAGPHARFCPHVSFANPRQSKTAPPRESIETRSIIITKS